MRISWFQLTSHLFVVCGVLGGGTISADASPYYQVTDLGPSGDVDVTYPGGVQDRPGYGGDPVSVENIRTMASYPFLTTTGPELSQTDLANLPSVAGMQGVLYPQSVLFQMRPTGSNASGTVIGELPSGEVRSDPWQDLILGYTQKQPDGQFSGFKFLEYQNIYNSKIFLSQNNQILTTDDLNGAAVLDLKTGVDTPITQLLPPDILTRFATKTGVFTGLAIDDNGDLLVQTPGADGGDTLLLTPPGQIAPAPIPEPTTLVTFAIVLSDLVLRRRTKRSP